MPIKQYFLGVIYEFKHVRWLNRYVVLRLSVIVVIVAVIVALFLVTLDFGFQTLLNEFKNLLK